MEAPEEAPPLPIDEDDLGRQAVESDDEWGPDIIDDEVDALPPDGLLGENDATDDAAAAGGEAEAADAAAEPHPDKIKALALKQEEVGGLKVKELVMHCKWRGLPETGKKAELGQRLMQAFRERVAVLDKLPEIIPGMRGLGAAAAAARPCCTGPGRPAPLRWRQPKHCHCGGCSPLGESPNTTSSSQATVAKH